MPVVEESAGKEHLGNTMLFSPLEGHFLIFRLKISHFDVKMSPFIAIFPTNNLEKS
jgi:hypothetical protein